MPTAHEVAQELRKLADALDAEPEVTTDAPLVFFHPRNKQMFLDQVRIFPKPLFKSYDGDGMSGDLEMDNSPCGGAGQKTKPAIWLKTQIARSEVCRVVKPAQPAEYDCEPLLSQAEEDALTDPAVRP